MAFKVTSEGPEMIQPTKKELRLALGIAFWTALSMTFVLIALILEIS